MPTIYDYVLSTIFIKSVMPLSFVGVALTLRFSYFKVYYLIAQLHDTYNFNSFAFLLWRTVFRML